MPTVTDFYRSYVSWGVEPNLEDDRKPGHIKIANEVRILIDARCTILNAATGVEERYFLAAPCRTEWMYRDTELIQNPSGEHRLIFGEGRQLFVGKGMHESLRPHGSSTSTDSKTFLNFRITESDAEPLVTDAAIVEESAHGIRPIVAKTEIVNAERGLSATLEYPIRTMNYNPQHKRFQVDTGPLIFPDFDGESTHLIDRCKLAHAVYNRFDYAEFVCKRPTPLFKDGVEVSSVFHYSDFRRLEVKSTLFAAKT